MREISLLSRCLFTGSRHKTEKITKSAAYFIVTSRAQSTGFPSCMENIGNAHIHFCSWKNSPHGSWQPQRNHIFHAGKISNVPSNDGIDRQVVIEHLIRCAFDGKFKSVCFSFLLFFYRAFCGILIWIIQSF